MSKRHFRDLIRILDDRTRKLAAELSDLAVASVLSSSPEEGRAAMSRLVDLLIELNERIGVLLRELDLDECT